MSSVMIEMSDTERIETIRGEIARHGLETVIVGWTDINSMLRGKRVPASVFAADPAQPSLFTDYALVLDPEECGVQPDPNCATYFPSPASGYGDMAAVPDLSTFRVLPWLERTGLVLADNKSLGGDPVPVAPRHVLRRVTDALAERGFSAEVGPEFEFFVLRESSGSLRDSDFRQLRTLFDRLATYGVAQGSKDADLIGAMVSKFADAGIEIEQYNVEGGAGQYELNMRYAPAPEIADAAMVFRHGVKEMCAQRDLLATFMPKLFPGFGSGLHMHVSVLDQEGANVFYSADVNGLSSLGQAFMAGCLATLREMTAIFSPTVNGYKRLIPYSYAGTTPTWGHENRSVGIRAILAGPEGTRIEHRSPGADANPYLTMAAILAGGLHGIDIGLTAPDVSLGDVYADPSIESVPTTLSEASQLLRESQVANERLGEDFVNFYARTRDHEWQCFLESVTDWEYRRYLEVL